MAVLWYVLCTIAQLWLQYKEEMSFSFVIYIYIFLTKVLKHFSRGAFIVCKSHLHTAVKS